MIMHARFHKSYSLVLVQCPSIKNLSKIMLKK